MMTMLNVDADKRGAPGESLTNEKNAVTLVIELAHGNEYVPVHDLRAKDGPVEDLS